MQHCPYCKIEVGGNLSKCPLCQNPLSGTPSDEAPYWPEAKPLKTLSLAAKIVLFVLLSATFICLALDFLLGLHADLHWSVLVAVFSLSALLILFLVLDHPRLTVPRFLFQMLLLAIALSFFTEWFLGYRGFSLDYMMPILCSAVLVMDIVFIFVDARFTQNTLVYFLMNVLIGLVTFLVLALLSHVQRIPWMICLIISVLGILSVLVFKWHSLWLELQKRLHM